VSVTVVGRGHLGGSVTSARVRIGLSACGGSVWLSDSGVVCRGASAGVGGGLQIALTVGLDYAVGSMSVAMSYDAATGTSFVVSNGPSSGGVSVFVFGRGTGTMDGSYRIRIGLSGCEAGRWSSSSSIVCKVGQGATGAAARSAGLSVFVTVGTRFGSHSHAWTYCAGLAMTLGVSSIPSTGGSLSQVTGKGITGNTYSARSRFSRTAYSSTVWSSDSCIVLRSSTGAFSLSTFPLVITTALATISHSSALTYSTPITRGTTSQLLGAISITGSNFGTYPAVVVREVVCSGGTVPAMQSAEICANDLLLQFRESPVPITEAAVRISFTDVFRLDDVSLSIVSPSGKTFMLMRNNCFGCFENCGQSRDATFSFQVPPAVGVGQVPQFLCQTLGDYVALDGPDLFQQLGMVSSFGRWSVRVIAGSQALNISRVSIKFETSTIQVRIGASDVGTLAWIAESSVIATAPGYQPQPQPSAAGWGRHIAVTASDEFNRTCFYSYPDPAINTVTNRDLGLGTGSNLISVTGRYFANADSSVQLRFFATLCVRSSWASDTSVNCHSPKISKLAYVLAISVKSSAVAIFPLNTSLPAFSLMPITATYSNTTIVPMTGGNHAIIAGFAFGMWDSSLQARIDSKHSAASVTKWLHDSSIALSTKAAPGSVGNRTFLLSVDATIREFDIKTDSTASRPISALEWFVSTGSQITALTGVQLGLYSSSVSVKVLQTSAQYSVWFSDSSTHCKSSSGHASQSSLAAIIVSLDFTLVSSPPLFSFAAPVIVNVNVVSAANASITLLEFFSANSGGIRPFFNLSLSGTMCTSTVWTSDSHIKCMNSWQLSKDYLFLETSAALFEFVGPHESIYTGSIVNPDFIPAPRPIAESFIPFAFAPMSQETFDIVAVYAKYGAVSGLPDFFTGQRSASMFQYAEIVTIDVLLVCNHTQVYLKDYQPVPVDVQVTFSLQNRDDGASLDHFICGGRTSMSTTLPANRYAAVSSVFICFCPNITMSSTVLRSSVAVKNETGSWIKFVAHTPSFSLVASNQASLLFLNSTFSAADVQVGEMLFPAAQFRLNSSTGCNRLQFYFLARLSCAFSDSGQFNGSVAFFMNGNASLPVFVIQKTVSRSCVFSISGVSPIRIGVCFISVTVPTFPDMYSRSTNVSVVNGDPFTFKILGHVVSELEEGAIIWSVNTSGSKCLRFFLYDQYYNPIMQCQNSFELSAAQSNASQASNDYPLYGSTRGESDCQGALSWCSARVTRSGVIRLKISSSYFNRTVSSAINVTGQGAATNIAILTPQSKFTLPVQAGDRMPAIQIQVTNAVGTALTQTNNIVVKIRVNPKNSSVRCFLSHLSLYCVVRSVDSFFAGLLQGCY